MKMFKKLAAAFTASALILGCAPNAFAAENVSPSVHLNGAYIEAETALDHDRTYMDADQLFAALGADEVVKNGATLKATKGDKEILFTFDNGLFFEKGGAYMIPIRPAAEAFGVSVGWDGANNTVILIDMDAVLGDPEADYTVMEKFMAYSKELADTYPVMAGKITFGVTVDDGTEAITLTGDCTVDSITTAEEMTLNTIFTFNFDEMEDLLTETYKTDPDFRSVIDTLSRFTMDMYMDIPTGKLYLSSDIFPLLLGAGENTWILVDYNEIFGAAGMTGFDFSALSNMSKMDSFAEYAATVMDYTSALENVYMAEAAVMSLSMIKELYSDASFIKDGSSYTSVFAMDEAGVGMEMALILNTKNDTITGYKMTMSTTADGLLEMVMDMDLEGTDCTLDFSMNMLDMIIMDMDGTFTYERPSGRPLVRPTEDSYTVSLMDIFL